MSTDPKKVIEEIIGRGISWYSYESLEHGAWRMYYNDAQYIVNSEVFNNELNHYLTDLLKFIGVESKDFDQVLHTRTGMTVLESFKKRLAEIQSPDKNVSKDEPFDAI